MRRGTQGHATKPCGPTRAPAWREGDMWLLFLFMIYISGYSTYKSSTYGKTLINHHNPLTLYTRKVAFNFTVWDYVPRSFLVSGDVVASHTSDQGRDD